MPKLYIHCIFIRRVLNLKYEIISIIFNILDAIVKFCVYIQEIANMCTAANYSIAKDIPVELVFSLKPCLQLRQLLFRERYIAPGKGLSQSLLQIVHRI